MNKRLQADKYLVVEQKGWRVVFLGLAIAGVISLTFKAVFSPRRIQFEIERVLSAADPRLSISAEGAHLSLSDGLIPRLAIVIDKLTIHSSDPCINKVNANIENLEMPIAFSSLLSRNLVFNKVVVGRLHLEMNAKPVDCTKASGKVSTTSNMNRPDPPLMGQTSIINSPNLENNNLPIKESEIQLNQDRQQQDRQQEDGLIVKTENEKPTKSTHLTREKQKIESPPLVQTMSLESKLLKHIIFLEVHLKLYEWPQFKWKLNDIDVQLPSNDGEKTLIDGLISLTSTSNTEHSNSNVISQSFQGINANVEAKVDHNLVEIKIHGAWREGRIEVEGNWNTKNQDFVWSGDFRQIPWGQIIILAKALGRNENLPISSQAWVTTKFKWIQNSEKPEHIDLSDTQIEGEFGDFLIGRVMIDYHSNNRRWFFSPYKILMKEINVDILAKMIGWEKRFPAFNKLGIFDGEALFIDNRLDRISGDLNNIKIIFFGKGRSEVQTINRLKLLVEAKEEEWSGSLKEIELESGQWKGDVLIDVDQARKTIRLDTQFVDIKLSPEVEAMMTKKGQLSPLNGSLNVDFVDGKAMNVKGYLKLDQAIINNFSLEKPRIDFESESDNMVVKVQMQELRIPRSQLDYWPHQIPEEFENLRAKNITGNFNQNLTGIEIKELQGQLIDLKSRFSFEAKVNSKEFIEGQLQIRNDRKTQQMYKLSGTRKDPKWTAHD